MIATNAATFCENLEAERMKDVPIYRDYIPDANSEEAKRETGLRCYALKSDETKKMIASIPLGEVFRISDIPGRGDMTDQALWGRLNRSDCIERVGRGLYRRIK